MIRLPANEFCRFCVYPCASRIIPMVMIVKIVVTLKTRKIIFKRFAALTLNELMEIRITNKRRSKKTKFKFQNFSYEVQR